MYLYVIGSLIILYYVRKYFSGGVCISKKKLFGKTAIVTGGTAGIGKETARSLSNRGARVILAVRNLEKAKDVIADIAESTGNSDIRAMKLDLSSLESVSQFAKEFKSQEDRLDILVNNAGIALHDGKASIDGYELVWQSNYLGHFLLTLLLLDLLKKSAPSRVVNVSSAAHELAKRIDYSTTIPGKKASYVGLFRLYGQSKYAQLLFTKKLDELYRRNEVTAYSLHPGSVRTDIFQHLNLKDRYFIFGLVSRFVLILFGKDSRQGAQTSIHCSVMPGIEKYSGSYFADCKRVKLNANRLPSDQMDELWTKSLEMVKDYYVHDK